ncbi:elongation factor 2 [Sorghum bicolor]|uniref:Tr-type G domain-containing protein n=1 Tax=Sorghum bicolor TaxID=4558 RepID=A0A1Z5RLB9_SORBI|nr:elongation factor 2 [Sorghum bicolor]OQU84528.1 hypothetical protein SORBI_3004G071401 [Sorghum bicolor]|eukprot:XP_002451693.2 elongation factor 2 [Sorghum bicolor]
MVKLIKEIPNTIIEKDHNHYGKNKSALDGERVRDIERVRNVVIICPRKHDKTKLLDSLLPSRGTGARAEEEGAGESGDLSFCYDMQVGNVQKDDHTFFINIIDSPGHADAPSKATSALTLADGAILLVDEGVSLHQGGLIKHAVSERIKTVLSLNILDSWLYRSIDDGEEVYQGLFQAIKNINEVMESYDDKLLGDLTFSPEKGTVAFTSMSYGWGFTLTSFSKMLAPLFQLDEAFIRKKIWGDNFFDMKTMTWTSKNTGSPSCLRGFFLH